MANSEPGRQLTTTLAITGMSCGGCVAHVAAALRRVPGVTATAIDLATASATVTHQPLATTAALVAAIEEEGYGAAVR